MSERVRGSVINVHGLGATVRLEDGRLAAVPLIDVNKHRAAYTRACGVKSTLPFDLDGRMVRLATTRADEPVEPAAAPSALSDDAGFEAQISAYLQQTQAWAPPDRPEPFERHLFRKRQRAKQFRGEGAS